MLLPETTMDIRSQGSRNLRQTSRSTLQRILLFPFVYSIITFTLVAAASSAISSPNQYPKISPSIRFHAPNETLKVWVLFVDKGILGTSNQRRALEQYQFQMSDRAKRRREFRTHHNRPDFTDLPVESHYIEAVLRLGGKLRSKSRWLNGIGLEATMQENSCNRSSAVCPCD